MTGVVGFIALRLLVEANSPLPETIGVSEGQLAPCPETPNCVSSQAEDPEFYVPPLAYTVPTAEARARLINALVQTPGLNLLTADQPNYIRAEFRSRVFGFFDDTEFYFDEEAGLIHVRSAARLGRGDMGANRARVERIRALFDEAE